MPTFVSEFYGLEPPQPLYEVEPNKVVTPRITHPDLELGKFVVIHCFRNNLSARVIEYDIPKELFEVDNYPEFQACLEEIKPIVNDIPDKGDHVTWLEVPQRGAFGLVIQHFIEAPDPVPLPVMVLPNFSLN
jgi:hypothetical protein